MIVLGDKIKIVDNIFYYPESISDEWLRDDIIRSIFKEHPQYSEWINRKDFIVIFAHGIPEKKLKSLVKVNAEKRILFIHCSENIYFRTKVISKVFGLFRKLRVPSAITNRLLFNNVSLFLLDLPFSRQRYFSHLVSSEKKYAFLLTNEPEQQQSNIFFAPYFYFYCKSMMDLIGKNNRSEDADSFKKRKFCAFIVSNPNNTDRIKLFKKLSAYKKIDSYGKLFNNVVEEKQGGEHYMNLLVHNYLIYRNYKFAICFENSYAKGYITEKLINVMAGGAIPIYRGGESAGRYFNAARIIDYNNYKSIDQMVDTIIALDQDDNKYEKMAKEAFLKNDRFPEGYENLRLRLNGFVTDYLNGKL